MSGLAPALEPAIDDELSDPALDRVVALLLRTDESEADAFVGAAP